MKKKIILGAVLIIIAMLAIFLPGCGSVFEPESIPEKAEENPAENIVFELEKVWSGRTGYGSVIHYKDTTTNIIYLYDNSYNRGGITVMPDPETGLPLTYDRYLEIYTVKED